MSSGLQLLSEQEEDQQHVSGHMGIVILGVRQDAPDSLVDTDGDYTPITLDAAGRLASAPSNYFSEVALGNIDGRASVNKFGIAPSGVQTTATDIWDRADATPTQQIWLAPTQARIHTIASTSTGDTTGSAGVDTVKVYYLPDWDTAEASETITGNLNAGIAMGESAVIVHRMKAVPQVSSTAVGGNIGTITATAAGDSTVTAVILPGNGQTEMAIYGVPSTHTALLHSWDAQIDKVQGTAASADFILRVNENPNVQTVAFLRKDDISVQSTGTNSREKRHVPPKTFPGPCIIKVQGIASAGDTDGEAGFDLELVTN